MVRRSYVTIVQRCVAAWRRQVASSCPGNAPASHSASPQATIEGIRRRSPTATLGEMCSSRSSLSISAIPLATRDKLLRLGQHAFQCLQVDGVVVGQRCGNFIVKCLRVVNRGANSWFRPAQVPGDRRWVLFIGAKQQCHFPYCQRAALHKSLAASARIAKIDEGELRTAQALLHQARAGVARSPSVAAGHAL